MQIRQRLVLLVSVLVAALLVPLAGTAQAAPYDPDTISGTIYDSSWDSVQGITVTLYVLSSGSRVPQTTDVTNAQGYYEFGPLSPGTYYVGVTTTDASTAGYVAEWYSGASSLGAATSLPLVDGDSYGDVDITLNPIPTGIQGMVTGPTNAAVSNADVTAYKFEFGEWNWQDSTSTDLAGHYELQLAPGTYRIGVSKTGLADSYFKNPAPAAETVEAASDIAVTQGSLSTASVKMLAGATLGGTVSGPAGPLDAVTVTAYRYMPAWEDYDQVATTSTLANGTYSFAGLSAGTYKVRFAKIGFVSEYYDDAVRQSAAKTIVLTSGGSATGIGATLAQSRKLSGIVSGSSGPLQYADVTLYDAATGDWMAFDDTDAAGAYSFDVGPGNYVLRFSHFDYLDEYWNDKLTYATADPITVGGSDVTGRDATLNKPGKITGKVTADAGGAAINGAAVGLYERSGSSWYQSRSTTTAADGTYTFNGLEPGIYTVRFAADSYSPEFHLNQVEAYDATWVQVDRDVTKTIDAGLGAAVPVSGKVTDAAGADLSGVSVTIARKNKQSDGTTAFENFATGQSAANGTWSAGVAPGTYRVRFTKSGYRPEYDGDTTVATRAARFTVAAGQTKTGVDEDLDRYGIVTGTVTGPGGPVVGASVDAYSFNGSWSYQRTATTSASGAYSLGGITSDKVRLRFSAQGHTTEWHSDKANVEAAADLSTPLNTTQPVNAALAAPARTIGGTVTAAGGGPLDGVEVTVERQVELTDRTRWEGVTTTATNASGVWSTPVAPGTYRVGFEADGKVPEWHTAGRSADQATHVVVSGADVSGVNGSLDPAGTLSGTVTDADGPVDDAWVTVYRPRGPLHPGEWVETDFVLTNASGAYSASGLPTGPYLLQFEAQGHVSEWNADKATQDEATAVTVTEGQTTTTNAILAQHSRISGKVTRPDGTPAVDADVRVSHAQGGVTDNVSTGADGTWSARVPAGQYVVCASAFGLASECRDGKPTADAADPVTVGATDVTGVDLALNPGGKVTGTVTRDGDPTVRLGDAYVTLYAQASDGSWVDVDSDDTDDAGDYTFARVLPGTYRLQFEAAGHAAEYHSNAATAGAGTSITVTDNGTSDVDAALQKRGTVGGRVLGAGGPVEDAFVQIYRQQGDGTYTLATSASTDADGEYLRDLAPGTYKLGFGANDDRVDEYYPGASTLAASTPVVVGTTAKTLLDVQLGEGAGITGTVTAPTLGEGWTAGVLVREISTGTTVGVDSVSTTDPTYRVDSLPAGSYRVEFARSALFEVAEGQYYQGKSENLGAGSATAVALTAGQEKGGIGATLVKGGTMSGSLRDTTGNHALAGCLVTAYTSNGALSTRGDYSKEDGSFRITGLTTGSYLLRLTGGECGVGYRYYTGSGTLSTSPTGATTRAVTVGQPTSFGVLGVPAPPPVQNTAAPTITGTAKVGLTLTAQPGTWTPADATFTYQWLRAGIPILNAVNATYTPVAADVGKALRVQVTATKGTDSGTALSAVTAAVAKGTLVCGTPTVSGTVRVGKVLTGAPKTCTPAATPRYAWLRNGVVITGKTAKTYTVVAADRGRQLQFRVTWTKAGYTTVNKLSAKTVRVP